MAEMSPVQPLVFKSTSAPLKGWGVLMREPGKLCVEELQFMPPGPNEVRVKIHACGLCQSDVSVMKGKIPMKRAMLNKSPIVLGHEGAGTIEAIGDSVSGLKVGDPVILSLVAPCMRCEYCKNSRPSLCIFKEQEVPVNRVQDSSGTELVPMSGLGCMAEYAIVSKNAVIGIVNDIPLDKACLVSCGVTTGVGAVMNRASMRPGQTCCVFGCGGVGISAIQGARICGARQIIAVDALDSKLEAAKRFGATHTVNSTQVKNVVSEVTSLSRGGTDYCFDAVGAAKLADSCVNSIKPGGCAVMIGISLTDKVSSNLSMTIVHEKVITGSMMGSSVPATFVPLLVDMYKKGDLMLDELVSKRYAITDAQTAFDDLMAGSNLRGVFVMHELASMAHSNSSKL